MASTLQSLKAPTQHPFPKSQAVPAPGPGRMELERKFRENAVSAFSWPTAEAKEAAPSSPHSGAAVQLPVLSGRAEERTVGAQTWIGSPGVSAESFAMSRNKEAQSRDGGLESGKNQGVTLFAEAGLRSLAFFLQVLQRLSDTRRRKQFCTCISLQNLHTTLHKDHGASSEIPLCNYEWPPPGKASRHQHNSLSEKASAVPAPGPGRMELVRKFRENAVSAFSWPTAEAKEAAPSSPHSGAAAQLPVLSGRAEERTVGAQTLISSPGTPCVRTAKSPLED